MVANPASKNSVARQGEATTDSTACRRLGPYRPFPRDGRPDCVLRQCLFHGFGRQFNCTPAAAAQAAPAAVRLGCWQLLSLDLHWPAAPFLTGDIEGGDARGHLVTEPGESASLSKASGTRRWVRYSPYSLISRSFSPRNVSLGKFSPKTSLGPGCNATRRASDRALVRNHIAHGFVVRFDSRILAAASRSSSSSVRIGILGIFCSKLGAFSTELGRITHHRPARFFPRALRRSQPSFGFTAPTRSRASFTRRLQDCCLARHSNLPDPQRWSLARRAAASLRHLTRVGKSWVSTQMGHVWH